MSSSPPNSPSDAYPSWLPKRPPPPVPASTFSTTRAPTDVFPTASPDLTPGRRPTPRSVRIVAREREPTGDSAETRVQPPLQPVLHPVPTHAPRSSTVSPRFRAPSLHLSLLRSPALSMRIRYALHPVIVFAHLPLQTYFDFNAVFMLIQLSSHPGPTNSSRSWSLASAAYIACYALQVLGVFLLYELVYSFWRRWRVKRPLILPIYLSSPAHNFAAMTSFTHFCFLAYIRRSARPSLPSPSALLASLFAHTPTPPPSGSPSPSPSDSTATSADDFALSAYIAERCYWLAQNGPTVALLLPRAALSLALLLTPPASTVPARDPTYFTSSGALTGYARGVLFANAAWTAWRALVLLASFLGLWILSGTACAGLCGPRYRWEEDEQNIDPKRTAVSDSWSWKEGTRARVHEAWEFCLTSTARPVPRDRTTAADDEFAGLEEVLAAVRPSVLSRDFFQREGREGLSDIIPPADEVRDAFGSQRSRRSDPLRVLPYPFEGWTGEKVEGGEKVDKGKGRETMIPFPSPVGGEEREGEEEQEDEEDGDEDEDDEDDEDGEEDEDDEDGEEDGEEEDDKLSPSASARRTSESMSSLGRPIPPSATAYPFAFRPSACSTPSSGRRAHTRSTPSSRSLGTRSHSHSHSTPSGSTPSNKESTDSPRSPPSGSHSPATGVAIPPPPARTPRHRVRRRRAGTVPSLPSPSSSTHAGPTPAPRVLSHIFATPATRIPAHISHIPARTRTRTRTISASNSSSGYGGGEPEVYESEFEFDEEGGEVVIGDDEDAGDGGEGEEGDENGEGDEEEPRVSSPEADGAQEEAEKEDSVGLLSKAPSLSPLGVSRRSSASASGSGSAGSRRSNGGLAIGTGVGAGPGTATGVAASPASIARSRAHSFVHALGQRASLSEFGMRTRVGSGARASGSNSHSPPSSNAHSTPSSNAHSSPHSHTHPSPHSHVQPSLRAQGSQEQPRHRAQESQEQPSLHAQVSQPSLHAQKSQPSLHAQGSQPSLRAQGSQEQSSLHLTLPGNASTGPNTLRREASSLSQLPSTSSPSPAPSPSGLFYAPSTSALSHVPSSAALSHAPSERSQRTHASEVTERAQVSDSRTDISTAHESFVTAPMTIDSTTTDSGGTGGSESSGARAAAAWERMHVPGEPWGHGPA
ncbi:hypothetical protein K439DRAFT_1648755 [Ramaria rubella]|nr:hypothetical protein K439DRAFT_1648755 [Ramaria rubella]